MHAKDLKTRSYFTRHLEEVKLVFSFVSSPCYGQDYEKGGIELVTCHFKFQNMFTKIHFLVMDFESGNSKEKEKNETFNISRTKTQRELFRGNKTFFIIF